jgi:hypothetical protein
MTLTRLSSKDVLIDLLDGKFSMKTVTNHVQKYMSSSGPSGLRTYAVCHGVEIGRWRYSNAVLISRTFRKL